MAFVVSTLQTALFTVFNGMSDGDNQVFADGIANAVVAFVSTGLVSTTDSGGIPTGDYTGSGTGTLTVTATKCASTIKKACDKMNDEEHGNDYLAEQIGKGLKEMADDGVVATTVTGKCTLPNGTVVSPYGGVATGTIDCDESSLVQDLKDTMQAMWDNRETEGYDGNSELAEALAQAVNDMYTSGQISTDGEANLEGSSGSGSIS